ncbi:GGDEF domain-containing protein [Angustibacter luteus]|uniref:GGDEF domain-containing protein n=1 Tax=Angustibacter luteus TaxID=658456 RepID=A0ABW1JH95_9ACTN
MERARFADMNERVATARRVQGLVISLVILVGAPTYTWAVVPVVLAGLLTLLVLERLPEHRFDPPRVSVVSIVVLMVLFGAVAMLTGGAISPYLPFLSIPTLMLAARFRLRVAVYGLICSFGIAAAAVLGAAALPDVPAAPAWLNLTCYASLMVGLAALSLTLLTAEMQSRGDAVVDQLTGLFNRKALAGRYAEAAAQARVLGAPVSLVLCDLDHFKQVNDQHGHDRGDVVLREAAYRMRKTLRTFDLVYRIGGEEFLVLLPGEDLGAAATVAERLVADVSASPLGGLGVTMSAGVSTAPEADAELDDLLKRADIALYAAKDAGRNCVRLAERLNVRV